MSRTRTKWLTAATITLVAFSTLVVPSSASAATCTVTRAKSATWTRVEARNNCLNVQARIDKYIQGSGIRTSLGYPGTTYSVVADNGGILSGNYLRTRNTSGWTGWISF